jgi:hypothetical protein
MVITLTSTVLARMPSEVFKNCLFVSRHPYVQGIECTAQGLAKLRQLVIYLRRNARVRFAQARIPA